MVSFESDYIAGAHPAVLRRLAETNLECLPGYGADPYCERAAQKIRALCGSPAADVYFLTGGTQANQIVLDAMLQPFQGVLAAKTGHVSVHEAGAIEYTGHKVLTLPEQAGKLAAADIAAYCAAFYADGNHEHMVFPGVVYLTFPTEYGTLYTKAELETIAAVCRKYGLTLYLDGARLGYGLASPENDVTWQDLARLCDAFTIGGTKVGALCGEAVVFPRGNAPAHFLTRVKQHGGLLAKGRLLGVQFDTLLTEDLYLQISRHAIVMAQQLCTLLREKGYQLLLDTSTNQQFVVLPNEKMQQLREQVAFSFWETYDANHTVVRFTTSWSTTQADLDALAQLL